MSYDKFFPDVNHGIVPTGGTVLIQGKFIPSTTKSGIILHDDLRQSETYDIVIGKIVAMGPLAYKNKETLEPYKEGNWCEVGDYVFMPRSGSRLSKEINDERYHFVMLEDTQIKAVLKSLDGFSQFEF